jgi:hypothetical protein
MVATIITPFIRLSIFQKWRGSSRNMGNWSMLIHHIPCLMINIRSLDIHWVTFCLQVSLGLSLYPLRVDRSMRSPAENVIMVWTATVLVSGVEVLTPHTERFTACPRGVSGWEDRPSDINHFPRH